MKVQIKERKRTVPFSSLREGDVFTFDKHGSNIGFNAGINILTDENTYVCLNTGCQYTIDAYIDISEVPVVKYHITSIELQEV